MSNVNIKRAIENIRTNTTVYTPIVEMVVNAIQAIESSGKSDGKVIIQVHRSPQIESDGSRSEVQSFEIQDNGIGFTDANRESFDTLYSDLKIKEGGKGFGRFTCLKYFENLHVDSVYEENGNCKNRKFSMGNKNDFIVNEIISDVSKKETGTIIFLEAIKTGKKIDKKLNTIAKNLAEKLLPYFISNDYTCPKIILSEKDVTESITLNDYFNNHLSALIKEISAENSRFLLNSNTSEEEFLVRIFKIYSPKNQSNKVSLVAHRREVSVSSLKQYVPEFFEEFYETNGGTKSGTGRNYVIKAYVFSQYLDQHVSLERGGFEFEMENDLFFGISQFDIESKAAIIAKEAVGSDIKYRQEKKRERFQSYVDNEAPWHKDLLKGVDLSRVSCNPSDEEIEGLLQEEKFKRETQIKKDIDKILSDGSLDNLNVNVKSLVGKISETNKNDLIHYIALRKNILDIFAKSLQIDETGTYSSEAAVHDIIFPRSGDTDTTSFEGHNLWILDERLNFTSYVSSDKQLNGRNSDRTDLLVFNQRILFRGDNEASNPVTIFEFKKPMRDDFANSSREDPVQQIVRYVNSIRNGEYKTPEGRKILVTESTPFYGYVVCDLTSKVENWLQNEKNFTQMPDRLGWYDWLGNIKLYIEVLAWDKVLKDAEIRSKVFFQKLGI
jgi:hypothetical protein